MIRGPKYKTFNGKRYERVGSEPTTNPNARGKGSTMSLRAWCNFQRRVNHANCRIVKVSTPSVYEAYIRYRSKR